MNNPHKYESSGIDGSGRGHDMKISSPALDLSRIAHDYADEIQAELISRMREQEPFAAARSQVRGA